MGWLILGFVAGMVVATAVTRSVPEETLCPAPLSPAQRAIVAERLGRIERGETP